MGIPAEYVTWTAKASFDLPTTLGFSFFCGRSPV
jgi:hypothetical protein